MSQDVEWILFFKVGVLDMAAFTYFFCFAFLDFAAVWRGGQDYPIVGVSESFFDFDDH